jgi:hypothetical protein
MRIVAHNGARILGGADFVRMIKWLGEDPVRRSSMGDACYEAAAPFHISRIAERYREFLRSL